MTVSSEYSPQTAARFAGPGLPGAIAEALAQYARTQPVSAAVVAETLPIILADVLSDDAWHYSPLTGDGFPLEFNFSSASDALTYTTEVAGPSVDPLQRLALIDVLLERLGARPAPHLMTALSGMQTHGKLRFGAWLRVRLVETEPVAKIYAETPESAAGDAQSPLLEVLGVRSLLPGASAPRVRMIGYDVDSGALEFYFRQRNLEPWQLERLCQIAGFGERFAELAETIGMAAGRPLGSGMPGTQTGFSMTLDNHNRPVRFAAFFFARSLFGGDARIRRSLLRLAQNAGSDLGAYSMVSAPLANRDHAQTLHGMVGFSVATHGPVHLGVGLRPPD